MMKHFIVCREHIIVVPEFLWCPMNYYRDDELNYRDHELNYGYVTNIIHKKKEYPLYCETI